MKGVFKILLGITGSLMGLVIMLGVAFLIPIVLLFYKYNSGSYQEGVNKRVEFITWTIVALTSIRFIVMVFAPKSSLDKLLK